MTQGVCIIIGAGAGLGAALARRFGREEMHVALVARQEASLAPLITELTAQRITAQSFLANAGDEASLTQALFAIQQQWGGANVLIYNAAQFSGGPPSTLSPDDLVTSLRTNVVGALVATQSVLPAMRERGRGTILFTGGDLATYPIAQMTALGIGKAAIRHLAFDFADEVSSQGIHVATVTISGSIQPGTHFDPHRIADVFWQVHSQPQNAWETECVYR